MTSHSGAKFRVTRRDFLAVAGILGLTGSLSGCSDWFAPEDNGIDGAPASDGEKILIIGAGAAGMAAGHLLRQRGVDFQILEAAPTYGGRIKRTSDFVDFPIPLGGEWLHVSEDTLAAIVNDDSVAITQRMQSYADDDPAAVIVDGELEFGELGGRDDLKFIGATWLDFFDEYLVPGISDRMVFDTPIVNVDHGGDNVTLTDASGVDWTADRIILTAPMKALKDGDITFSPEMPEAHVDALQRANIWTGMKVFLEFTERFYPVFMEPEEDDVDGQLAYYDAAYGQDSESHVLGLFTVGESSLPYQALDPGDALRDYILDELDPLFDGAASRTYVQHISQNWRDEPFIGAAYLADTAETDISQVLGQNIGPRVFMAGCGYTREFDWSSVHAAVRAARDAVDEMFP